MAKDKLPKPIFFPEGTESGAMPRFKELKAKKCYGDLYLIGVTHWAAKGSWITFKLPELSDRHDTVIEHHHNPKPIPWVAPVRNEPEEEDEEE